MVGLTQRAYGGGAHGLELVMGHGHNDAVIGAGLGLGDGGNAVFVLGLGQKVAVTPSASVKLDKINDSRCRAGAVCVWAGYVSYRFILSSKAGSAPFVLSESMPGGAKSATRQRFTFTLVSVQPAAPPGLNEAAPNYRITLKVTGN